MIRYTTLTVREALQSHSSLAYFNQMYLQLQEGHHHPQQRHMDQESQERVT